MPERFRLQRRVSYDGAAIQISAPLPSNSEKITCLIVAIYDPAHTDLQIYLVQ